jgi:ADP-ribosyl-[dinitrogen reductase] hydrolase
VHRIAAMTHGTPVAAAAAAGQAFGLVYCLGAGPLEWRRERFFAAIEAAVRQSLARFPPTPEGDLLRKRVSEMAAVVDAGPEAIGRKFGRGSCKSADSAPFSWTFFARCGGSIKALFDVIDAGGDTDSNGAVVGALVGALHGKKAVPSALLRGIVRKDRIIEEAAALAARLRARPA